MCVCVCVCVCPPPRLLITSGMMWCDVHHQLTSSIPNSFYMAAVISIVSTVAKWP